MELTKKNHYLFATGDPSGVHPVYGNAAHPQHCALQISCADYFHLRKSGAQISYAKYFFSIGSTLDQNFFNFIEISLILLKFL